MTVWSVPTIQTIDAPVVSCTTAATGTATEIPRSANRRPSSSLVRCTRLTSTGPRLTAPAYTGAVEVAAAAGACAGDDKARVSRAMANTLGILPGKP